MKPAASKHPLNNKRALRTALLHWFDQHREDHPWRQTSDPYHILVSEIMLQQTTVAAVRQNQRFEKFLHTFPDLQTLATAPEQKLLKAWEGLGYYNRVRNLQKTAQAVLDNYNGQFPSDPAELEALPGVGKYTAGAVASFAFNIATPIVDANIARVLARLFDDPTPVDSTAGLKLLWDRAAQLVDPQSPREFNSALMELGQTNCNSRQPDCLLCPINNFCQTKSPTSLPVKKPKRKTVDVTEHALLVRNAKGHLLLAQESGSRRNGFWKLPQRTAEQAADLPLLTTRKYGITHHRVTLHIHQCPPNQIPPNNNSCPEQFHPPDSLSALPMQSPIRKALDHLL